MKNLTIFLSKSQEVLEENDVDTFAELPYTKFQSSVTQCPFLSHFSEETLESLHQSLQRALNTPLDSKWESYIETCDLQACVEKLKALGEDVVLQEVKKDGLLLQPNFEQNAHVLTVFSVMNKAQSNN
jgi:hypothetical protein